MELVNIQEFTYKIPAEASVFIRLKRTLALYDSSPN
jgi:hypothetical protein